MHSRVDTTNHHYWDHYIKIELCIICVFSVWPQNHNYWNQYILGQILLTAPNYSYPKCEIWEKNPLAQTTHYPNDMQCTHIHLSKNASTLKIVLSSVLRFVTHSNLFRHILNLVLYRKYTLGTIINPTGKSCFVWVLLIIIW